MDYIVCPIRNESGTVKTFINNINKICFDCKIIFVDSGSTKEEIEKIKTFLRNKDELILLNENVGYDNSVNTGLNYISNNFKNTKYVYVSNSDVSFDLDCLFSLKRVLENNKDVGFVAPTMFLYGKKVRSARDLPTIKTLIKTSLYFRKTKFYKTSVEIYKRESRSDCQIVGSVNAGLICMNMFLCKKVGFFDSNIFMYFDEDALSFKLLKLNYKTAYCPNLICYHNHKNLSNRPKNIRKRIKKSELYFVKTYLNPSKIELFKYRLLQKCYGFEVSIIKVLVSIKHLFK